MNAFNELILKTQNIANQMNFEFTTIADNGTSIVIAIFDRIQRQNAGEITLVKSTHSIHTGITRSSKMKEKEYIESIYVQFISVNSGYNGLGLSKLLIVYGICFFKLRFPNIEYASLEDESERNKNIKKNLYGLFGFENTDPIKLSNTFLGTIETTISDEKHVKLDSHFIYLCNRILDNFRIVARGRKRKQTLKKKRKTHRRKRNGTRHRKR